MSTSEKSYDLAMLVLRQDGEDAGNVSCERERLHRHLQALPIEPTIPE